MSHSLASLFHHPPSPVEEIQVPLFRDVGIRLLIKRDDLLRMGPGLALCGNKWRKLQYNLLAAREGAYRRLLTFGGAFSNHIAAVAAAGQVFGFQTIGIIRGERPGGLNPTLRFAEACGMQMEFVSRAAFRKQESETFQAQLREHYGRFYRLPEGGTNRLAIQGCSRIINELETQLIQLPTHICVSAGTAGTLAGIIAGLNGQQVQVLGFSALKGDFLHKEVKRLLGQYQNTSPPELSIPHWAINTHFHFGGYARFTPPLIDFINGFYRQYGIALDPIYTGKLFYGLFQLAEEGYFPGGSTVLAIHTGGLQGIAGFNERFGQLLEWPG